MLDIPHLIKILIKSRILPLSPNSDSEYCVLTKEH